MTGLAGIGARQGRLSIERGGEAVARATPFLLGALVPGILAADQGGYWPTAWGWATIALAWIAALGLVLRPGRVSALELTFAGSLAAFTGWTALSLLWTSSTTQTVLVVERTLVYVVAATAVAGAVRSASYRGLVWGVWAGATADCVYGLLTRLVPDHLGQSSDLIAGYRLSAPVGYWNGLGLLAALASILALGLAAHAGSVVLRAVAAASLPLLLPTLYLTFSRGAWLSLVAALVATVLLTDRRLGFLVAFLVLAVPSAAAVWCVERAKALHVTTASLAEETRAGHALLWQLPLIAVAAAALSAALALVGRRTVMPRAVRHAFAGAVVAAALAAVAVGVVHYGGPAGVVRHARHSFEGVAPGGTNLNSRLFSLSSNGRLRQWHVALDEWRAHRLLGGGAGTYAQYWGAAGNAQPQILNVHNLYLETLAELGPVGLLLLVVALLAPVVAAVRARRRSLVPVAAGAYVAFLVHAGYDWDWQLAGVTLAALLCAGAVLVAARTGRRDEAPAARRYGLLALALTCGVAGFLGLLGNRALAQSGNDLRNGNFAAAAAAAADARRWAPWSSEPWQQLAVIRTASGDRAGAREAYRRAIAKDPRAWQLWLGLAGTSRGAERAHALAILQTLHPGAASGSTGTGP
jgi:O-Antigen ligase